MDIFYVLEMYYPSPSSLGSFQYLTSVRGNALLSLDGYAFTLNRKKNDTFYWECTKKRNKLNCNSRIVTLNGMIKSVRGLHNHPLSDDIKSETIYWNKK